MSRGGSTGSVASDRTAGKTGISGEPGASDKLDSAVGAIKLHSIQIAEQMLLRVETHAAPHHHARGNRFPRGAEARLNVVRVGRRVVMTEI